MWWWRKVHRADIPLPARVLFERYGETVVALLLANELAEHPPGIIKFGGLSVKAIVDVDAASVWLTERADLAQRREDRLETVEWAVLIFVVVGVIADILLVLHL
jgi:hypothetical protein